jgi:hypothetical protein
MGKDNLLRQLKQNPSSSSLDFSGFRSPKKFTRHLSNESTKDMRIIARLIKRVHENGSHDEVDVLCQKFNLTFLSQVQSSSYLFVKKDFLTRYESENGVVTITAYKGDSWFKDIDSKYSKDTNPQLRDLSQFYFSLLDEKNSLNDPIKIRTIDYSLHMLTQRYSVEHFDSDNYDVFAMNDKAMIIDKVSKDTIEIEIQPILGFLNRIFRVYQRLGLVFYITAILLLATYSLQSIQIDVIAPYINFKSYNHELGEPFDSSKAILSIDDNIDSSFNIQHNVLNQPSFTDPGDVLLNYEVYDRSGNKRYQSTTITLVDTTRPVISPSTLNSTIEFDAFRSFDYTRLVEVKDNHKVSSVTYETPFSMLSDSKPLGDYRVVFNAEDPSGNKASFVRNVTIVDTVPPTFNLSAPTVTVNYNVARTYNYTQHATNVRDNYDSSRVRLEHSTNYNYEDPGTHPFTITAIDVSGNRFSQTLNVNVVDTTPPVVRVVGEITVNVSNISSFNPQAMIQSITDNHRVQSITQSPVSIFNNRSGAVNFETTATDASGNRTTAITRVILVDTIAPRIQVLQASSTYTNRIPTSQEILNMVRVTDNWDTRPSVTWSGNLNSSRFGTSNTITITAQDAAGNRTSTTVRITIVDNIAPQLTFKDNGLQLTVSQAQASKYQYSTIRQNNNFMDFVAGVSDNLSSTNQIFVSLIDNGPYNITQIGVVTLRFRVTDNAGNSADFNYTITTIANPPSGGS